MSALQIAGPLCGFSLAHIALDLGQHILLIRFQLRGRYFVQIGIGGGQQAVGILAFVDRLLRRIRRKLDRRIRSTTVVHDHFFRTGRRLFGSLPVDDRRLSFFRVRTRSTLLCRSGSASRLSGLCRLGCLLCAAQQQAHREYESQDHDFMKCSRPANRPLCRTVIDYRFARVLQGINR